MASDVPVPAPGPVRAGNEFRVLHGTLNTASTTASRRAPVAATFMAPSVLGRQFAYMPVPEPDVDVKLAFLMGTHPRLGAHAPRGLVRLPVAVTRLVFSFVGGVFKLPLDVVADKLKQQRRRLLNGRPADTASKRSHAVTRVHHRSTDAHLALKPVNMNIMPTRTGALDAVMAAMARAYRPVGPCLLPLYGVVYLEQRVCLALLHMNAGSLQDVLEASAAHTGRTAFPEHAAAGVVYQILHGLQSLHAATGAAHGQLRPGRVLLSREGHVRIGGMPCPEVATLKLNSTVSWGTESLTYLPVVSGDVACKDDLFSAGLLAYRLLSGEPPYAKLPRGTSLFAAFRHMHSASPPRVSASRHAVSVDAAHMVNSCLRRDRTARPDVQQLLRHPWFAERHGIHAVSDARAVVQTFLAECVPPPQGGSGGTSRRKRRVTLRTDG